MSVHTFVLFLWSSYHDSLLPTHIALFKKERWPWKMCVLDVCMNLLDLSFVVSQRPKEQVQCCPEICFLCYCLCCSLTLTFLCFFSYCIEYINVCEYIEREICL